MARLLHRTLRPVSQDGIIAVESFILGDSQDFLNRRSSLQYVAPAVFSEAFHTSPAEARSKINARIPSVTGMNSMIPVRPW